MRPQPKWRVSTERLAGIRDRHRIRFVRHIAVDLIEARAEIDTLQAAVRELREALAPFAFFSTAVKGVPSEKDVVNYGRQGLRANAFYEAADVLARTDKLLPEDE